MIMMIRSSTAMRIMQQHRCIYLMVEKGLKYFSAANIEYLVIYFSHGAKEIFDG